MYMHVITLYDYSHVWIHTSASAVFVERRNVGYIIQNQRNVCSLVIVFLHWLYFIDHLKFTVCGKGNDLNVLKLNRHRVVVRICRSITQCDFNTTRRSYLPHLLLSLDEYFCNRIYRYVGTCFETTLSFCTVLDPYFQPYQLRNAKLFVFSWLRD